MAPLYAATEEALLIVAREAGERTAVTGLGHRDPTCVAAGPDAGRVFLGTAASGLYRSTDGGESFERVSEPGWTAGARGAARRAAHGSAALGTGAAVWTAGHASEAGRDPVTAVTVGRHDPAEVWLGTEPGRLYRSVDGGESFDPVARLRAPDAAEGRAGRGRTDTAGTDTRRVRAIAVDPGDPDRLLVGVEAGPLWLSADGGETWRERPPGAPRDVHALGTHPDAPGRVYAAAGDGFAASHDGGESWVRPQRGLDHRHLRDLAVDPGDPGTVLVAAARGAHRAREGGGAEAYVYRRTGPGADADPDAGTWTPLFDRGLPTGRGVLPPKLAGGDDPGEFFAVTNRGVYRTETAGDRWRLVDVNVPDRVRTGGFRGVAVV